MMTTKSVTDGLKKVLADSYALALKTQNYHWNVEGTRFRELHLMFQEQYTELAAAIDEVAERIRALGEKSPGGFAEFTKLSAIKDGHSNYDENQMVKDLWQSHQTLVTTLKKAHAAAEKAGDEPTVDLLVGRMAVHEKTAWMLRSSLPNQSRVKLAV
jgi:starvation-inducible DNA-binding protein